MGGEKSNALRTRKNEGGFVCRRAYYGVAFGHLFFWEMKTFILSRVKKYRNLNKILVFVCFVDDYSRYAGCLRQNRDKNLLHILFYPLAIALGSRENINVTEHTRKKHQPDVGRC